MNGSIAAAGRVAGMAVGTRYYQKMTVEHAGYRGAVEASVLAVAVQIMDEPESTWGYAERQATAKAIIHQQYDRDKFVTLFAWKGVYTPVIQQQVFDTTTNPPTIRPERLKDEDLDAMVLGFWNKLSNVPPQTQATQGSGIIV